MRGARVRAMILAAGRGERMRDLTRCRPKPLIVVGGKTLIEHQIERLRGAGFRDLVINLAYLGHQLRARLGNGERLGVRIRYSDEGERALGTGGGIRHALPLLGIEPVLVVNADVWTDYPYHRLRSRSVRRAHLVLVPNPPHVREGDFSLRSGVVGRDGGSRLTFSGVGVYDPAMFAGRRGVMFSLVEPLDIAAAHGQVTGERYDGCWADIGTPERLCELHRRLSRDPVADAHGHRSASGTPEGS
jgi:N-acetyl-alpha-D-muramate 1-phosphate uridylyltransferase